MMDFIALDVETANPNYASICQIGIAEFTNGKLINKQGFYINPDDYFDGFNVAIHGITEKTVINSPKFNEIAPQIFGMFKDKVLVTHTAFDILSINAACLQCNIDQPNYTWLDSAKVARRTWSDVAYKGYGLKNLAQKLNINFKHHDAVEDATAAGEIILAACRETGLSINDWLERIKKGINPDTSSRHFSATGDPDGEYSGETIAFTGALVIPRRQAVQLAAQKGFNIIDNVTKDTTILVVGNQDITQFAGHDKSSKHRKAEQLIAKGQEIRIIGETDFITLINFTG